MISKFYFASSALAAILISGSAFAAGSQSTVDQYGYNQQITIDQTGGSFDSVGLSGQSVQQDNGSYAGGSNYLNITQAGTNNSFGYYAHSYQSGQYNKNTTFQAGTFSNIESVQIGNSNGTNTGRGEGIIVQDGSADHSDVNMTSNGSYNVVQVSQGSDYNKASLTQTGNENYLNVNQGSSYAGGRNTITANQYGDNNTGYLYQASTNNTTALGQVGTSNYASVSQASAGNATTLNQNGTSNYANIKQ